MKTDSSTSLRLDIGLRCGSIQVLPSGRLPAPGVNQARGVQMTEYSREDLDRFQEAVQSLKLYRRADLQNSQGDDLIEELYIDPLPHDHVHNLLRRSNTTFLIGRKGTGKSTVFLRAQKSLLKDKHVLSTYVDIKTVYESALVDPSLTNALANHESALPVEALTPLLLKNAFLKAVVSGIRDDLEKQLSSSWKLRVKENFTGTYQELTRGLDSFVSSLDNPDFVNVEGIRSTSVRDLGRNSTDSAAGASAGIAADSIPTANISIESNVGRVSELEKSFSEVLLRSIDIRKLILGLKEVLGQLGIRHLYVFLDDFSELPYGAMQTVVDVLIAPLNNWSEELVKFKIAAYPGRIYYGELDKSKLDEVSLDLHSLYGQKSVSDMEDKAVDFTRRLVDRRLEYFKLDTQDFFDVRTEDAVWHALFNASLGNPRVLGYVLFFAYESHLLYDKPINVSAIADAAKRYYEDKVEPYFAMGRFLHETFEEKSTIFSLKELLERIVSRAKSKTLKESSSIFRSIEGRPPTSHFNTNQSFDSLLSTLELNFFLTKYYVMSNRDGQHVSVYALNYGLCEKYTITFGRPRAAREHRLYFVERAFDYTSLLQDYIATNQEIKCNNCASHFEQTDLEMLKRFNMLCPTCMKGNCVVTNISRKYENIIRSVSDEQLLPATELGILQTLNSEDQPLLAGDIAGELDVSHQLVGRRAKHLDEQQLLHREMVRNRRQYTLTDVAKRIYFNTDSESGLDILEDVDKNPL